MRLSCSHISELISSRTCDALSRAAARHAMTEARLEASAARPRMASCGSGLFASSFRPICVSARYQRWSVATSTRVSIRLCVASITRAQLSARSK